MPDSGEDVFNASAVFYDLDYRERADVSFWTAHIPRWGKRILEVGCGTGVVLHALQHGDGGEELSLHGFDISPEMVRRARIRTGLDTLEVADMRDFADLYPEGFDCVVIPFNSLMHLEDSDDWIATFRQCRRVLGGGGVLAFSLLNPTLEEWDDEGLWQEEKEFLVEKTVDGIREWTGAGHPGKPGERILYRKWYRKEIPPGGDGLIYLSFAFLPDHDGGPGERSGVKDYLDGADGPNRSGSPDDGLPRVHFRFPLRYAFPTEVMEMLHRCGFEMVSLWGDWEESPADEESETLVFVARVP